MYYIKSSWAFSKRLIPKIYGEYAFKDAFEGTKFGSGKHREFSAAPTVDPTVAPVHLNKRHVRDD